MKSGGRNSIFVSLPKPIPLYEFINFFTSSLVYTFCSLKRIFRIFFLIGCKVFLSSSRLSSHEFFSLRELCKLVGLTTAKFTLKIPQSCKVISGECSSRYNVSAQSVASISVCIPHNTPIFAMTKSCRFRNIPPCV